MILIHFSEAVWAAVDVNDTSPTITLLTAEDIRLIDHLDHEDIAKVALARPHVSLSTIFKIAKLVKNTTWLFHIRYEDLSADTRQFVASSEDFDQIKQLVRMLSGEA